MSPTPTRAAHWAARSFLDDNHDEETAVKDMDLLFAKVVEESRDPTRPGKVDWDRHHAALSQARESVPGVHLLTFLDMWRAYLDRTRSQHRWLHREFEATRFSAN